MRNVLIISYNFPPVGGTRVRRVMKFVKYLPEFNWDPSVLTVKNPLVPEYDFNLLAELSRKIKIVRTHSFEPISLIRDAKKHHSAKVDRINIFYNLKFILFKIVKKLKWLIFFPDSRIGWIPFCVWYGNKIIKQNNIDLIYVTGEPFSSFISGFLLKKITNKPLIVDFRDQWVGFSKYYFPDKPFVTKKLERIIEKIIIKNADKVISVTEPIVDDFIKKYKSENREKFLCITNGFDPEDFKEVPQEHEKDKKFIITYTGSLYRLRTPKYFLEAVKNIAETDHEFSKNIKIRFIGSIDKEILNLFENDDKLSKIIEICGFLSYKDTLKAIVESYALLYIEDQILISDRLLPAKLFEYMAAKKPIIILSNGRSVKEVVDYTGCGKVIPSYDIKKIMESLLHFYNNFRKGEDVSNKLNINRLNEFSYVDLTRRLAAEFNNIIDGKTNPSAEK